MHFRVEALPDQAELGGLAVTCTRLPRGLDLKPALQGLPDNLCPCPHWGYLLEGRMLVSYADGSDEEIRAGDVYHLQAGHTAVVEEDAISIDFSPIEPLQLVMRHLAAKRQAI